VNQRTQCKDCGAAILVDTAAKNNGLCMPCKGGYRERIEQGKQSYAAEKAYRASPEARFWKSLVERVHNGAGFASLSLPEQKYYAVLVLNGEVHNGGFDQYFWNHSGSYYLVACEALLEIGASQSLAALRAAKAVVFGTSQVPESTAHRHAFLRAREKNETEANSRAAALESLNHAFYEAAPTLTEKVQAYATRHQLLADF
jgi:hypothetical protein